MKKAKSDKAPLNISDDEEVSQDSPQIHTVNEQSEKNANMLQTLKNFFKNHGLGKNSTKNESKKESVKSGNESIKNYKNTCDQLLIKNGGRRLDRNVDNINGRVTHENGKRQTNNLRETNQQFPSRNHELKSDRNNVIGENTRNGSLHANPSVRSPSEFANRTYENVVPSKPLLQRGHENANPKTRVRNNREDRIREGIVNEKRAHSVARARAPSPNVEHRRNFPRGHSEDARSTPFYVMRFIRNNIRRMSLPNLHSGGVVLLNNIEGRDMQFAELRADMDPIRVNTSTHERMCNVRLMSGGSVVLEGFSDGFDILDFSREVDPLVVDVSPDDILLPETSQFEISKTATSRPPLLVRSHSGGGHVEVNCSAEATLPELFPTKTTPPRRPSLHRPHSGGGIVESNDVQNQIFLDLLSQSIIFNAGQSTPRPPTSNDQAGNIDS